MYYILDEVHTPHRWMDDSPYLEDISFWKGAIIKEQLPEPLEYTLEPLEDDSSYGPHMPAYYKESIPLWRDDMIQALKAWRINNFDTYDAVVFDPDNGHNYLNYKAVNILGLVACADMDASEAEVHDGIPLIDVDFSKLVINEKRTYGMMLFRLAESASTILVHEKLRNYLENQGFANELKFWEPGEIAV